MIKINLNELRSYNVLVYGGNEEEYGDEYLNLRFGSFGFIEDIYTKCGEIIFKVYGWETEYNPETKLKHIEVKIDMKYIDVCEKKTDKNYDIYIKNKEYEYISIKESNSYNYNNTPNVWKTELRLFKNLDFSFLMRRAYELIPSEYICLLEIAMLEDTYVLNKVTIPEDYEFATY